jgi:hypothetical protein
MGAAMKFPNRPRLQFQKILKATGWKYIGLGRHREVWHRGNYVLKIPLSLKGLEDNWRERHTWKIYQNIDFEIKYAACRLYGNFLLIMEYAQFVGPLSDDSGFISFKTGPEWMYRIDCCQVGYNRHGQIVAYDYGIN